MKRLRRLCDATRAISAQGSVTFHGVPDRDDFWVVRVAVRDIIIIETGAGLLDKVIVEAGKKLQALSQRVLLAVVANGDEPDSGPTLDSTVPPPPPKRPSVPPRTPKS